MGSIREYAKQFTSLLLNITNLTKKDKFFFMDTLQPWVEQELQWHEVLHLASVLAMAERLVNLKAGEPSTKPKNQTQMVNLLIKAVLCGFGVMVVLCRIW